MVFLLDFIPDAGWVVIITTIIIKIIIFPLYTKQIKTQIATKKAKPELDALKEKYKDRKSLTPEQRQRMVLEMMEIYKKYQIKPFSSILVLLIQIPILLALYWIFYKGGLPEINKEILYFFVPAPDNEISMNFLNIFDLRDKSVFLAFVAGLTQFLYLRISMPDVKLSDFKKPSGDFKEDMASSLQVNIKYGLPLFVFFILATALNSVIALYWIVQNLFTVFQELYVRKDRELIRALNKEVKEKKESKK